MQRQFDTVLAGLLEKNGPPLSGGMGKLVLAVSGGVDSMCLAQLCANSFVRPQIVVAHCNFHLRGEESDSDAAFVREWAEDKGFEFHIADFDTAGYASANGVSIEMAARELRYRWFAQLCRELGAGAVLTAHNANDNAETLLLNLVRGTGMRGLCGMSHSSRLPYSNEKADCESVAKPPVLLRPLLGFTRKQIEGYMLAQGFCWREDHTNADTRYKRNKLRNEIFPILESINPSFVRTLNREMHYFADAEGILRDWCAEVLRTFCEPYKNGGRGGDGLKGGTSNNSLCGGANADGLRINIPKLMSYGHWAYLLYMALEPYGFNSTTVSDLEALLAASKPAATNGHASSLPDNSDRTLSGKTFHSDSHILYTSGNELIVCSAPLAQEIDFGETAVTIPFQGTYTFGSCALTVGIVNRSEINDVKSPQGTLYADANVLQFPFYVRTWRRGDWLRPFGMDGQKKKVSDLFTDLKYNSLQKASSGFVVRHLSDTHILAMLGKRIDESLKITDSTTEVLAIALFDV